MTDNDDKITCEHTERKDVAHINDAITRLLARREHSLYELRRKLTLRDLDRTLCEQQLQKFSEANVQSDLRFAESFIRSRAAKGQEEQRIRRELREHQVKTEFVSQAFAEQEIDWFDLALRVKLKKFGEGKNYDLKEKFKIQRFLQYRGFSTDCINYALER